ncbi:hypothetical protein EWM64_g3559 [Hericium alpestre]|uniref:Uncharacterized protein n=1 Tax=Hericium alpestre TaxID=135208 RepID=A0A4Z0A2K4_9AGAM|nr:hypothetical protein EWM64_g3559 [Hericium alpestre]
MHRIMDVKAGGISRRNFSLFRALCGDASLKNVAIVTNFWDQVERDVGERREAELRSKDIFFKPVLDKGASMLRHEGTLQSAHAIMRHFVNNAPVVLQIQDEMVDKGLDVLQTGAAAQLDAEIREEARRHEKEVERARAEHRAAIAAQEEQARLDREREALRREQEMENELQRIREEALRLEQQRIAAAQEEERLRLQHEEEMRRQLIEAEAERQRAFDAAEAARRAHEQWVAQQQAAMDAIRNAPPPQHHHHGGGRRLHNRMKVL